MMRKDRLAILAKKIEVAGPSQQAELLCDAWDLLARPGWDDFERSVRFMRYIGAQAFESAAIMLVQEWADSSGERFKIEGWNGDGVHVEHVRASAWVAGASRVYAATVSLALAAACLRAGINQEEGM